jgi:hypothetical protein
MKTYHTPENYDFKLTHELDPSLNVKCYQTTSGTYEVVIGDEVYPLKVKKRSLGFAFTCIFVLGPAGFVPVYGLFASFWAWLAYFVVSVYFGPNALTILHIACSICPLIYLSKFKITDSEMKRRIKQYSQEIVKNEKMQRKSDEQNYYAQNGTTKLKNTILGDPNAKKSWVEFGKSIRSAIVDGDTSQLQKAKKHLVDALDPIEANKKAKSDPHRNEEHRDKAS